MKLITYVASVSLPALNQLQQVRELARTNAPGFDYSTADRVLARFRFVLELAVTHDCGPALSSADVVILEPEYAALLEVSLLAKLHVLPITRFDRRLYVTTMRQLCAAVGREAHLEWPAQALHVSA